MGETGPEFALIRETLAKHARTLHPKHIQLLLPCRIIPTCKFSAVHVVPAKENSIPPHCRRRILCLVCFLYNEIPRTTFVESLRGQQVKNTYELTSDQLKRTRYPHAKQLPHEGPSIPTLRHTVCLTRTILYGVFIFPRSPANLYRLQLQLSNIWVHRIASFRLRQSDKSGQLAPRFSRLRLSAPEKRRQRQRPVIQSTVPPTVLQEPTPCALATLKTSACPGRPTEHRKRNLAPVQSTNDLTIHPSYQILLPVACSLVGLTWLAPRFLFLCVQHRSFSINQRRQYILRWRPYPPPLPWPVK